MVSVTLDYDQVKRRFPTVVGILLYPQRLGRVLKKIPAPAGDQQQQTVKFLGDMVAHGLRAQVRSANLLTGQLYVSIEHVPNTPKVAFDETARPLTLPTVNGSLDRLQEQVAGIVDKIDKVPFEAIGKNLDTTLAELDKTLRQMDSQVLPEAAKTLQHAQRTLGTAEGALAEDAPLQHDLSQTLQEVRRTARSLRVLTDLLGRSPESLLRGRPDDRPAVPANPPADPPMPDTKQEPPR